MKVSLIGILMLFILLTGCFVGTQSSKTNLMSSKKIITVTSMYYNDFNGNPEYLEIINYEDYTLTNVKVIINSKYSYSVGTMLSGEKEEIDLEKFKDVNTYAFPTRTVIPIKIKIISDQGEMEDMFTRL